MDFSFSGGLSQVEMIGCIKHYVRVQNEFFYPLWNIIVCLFELLTDLHPFDPVATLERLVGLAKQLYHKQHYIKLFEILS